MRCIVLVCAFVILSGPVLPQERRLSSAQPNKFEIGRHTFFDFGPPSDFYEVFIVRPSTDGTSIARITLTPPGDVCFAPAKVETAFASTSESAAVLLGSTNPCTIPEKALRRELKRCKNCLVFSGADVVMEVQCGSQTRFIRSDILDRDWFDAAAKTPEHTSWTMQLLERLDRLVGPGVMDKPAFLTPESGEPSANHLDSVTMGDLSAGKYDTLFKGAPDKPSDLYRASQNRTAPPSVRVLSSAQLPSDLVFPPEYPPIARMAHVEGAVSFKIDIDMNGGATNLLIESGHPLLLEAVKKAVSGWRFPKDYANQQIQATIEFALNCPRRAESR